jgi:hypothetical protein
VLSRTTLVLNLLLVCGLAVSGLQIPGQVASGAGDAAVSVPTMINPAARWLDLDRVGRWLDLCDGAASIPLLESKLCTHGPDPAPAGYDVDKPVLPLLDPVATDEMAAIACDGDGQSGYRVQVLYVHGSNVQSRYDQFHLSIQGWSGQMDRIFQASAAKTGGARRVRFVHDTNCQPIVRAVKVSPAGDGSFDTTITELKNQGYNRADRIYLAFVDTTSAGICGIGTIWNDDRASGSVNWNNVGPSYARVDAGCWSGQVAAHEVMHNLGGVQLSAPNASAAFHCIDEFDVMCYRDGPGTATREDCPNQARDTTLFDCNHNDYYHTNPNPGSYLASYWNPAGNRFLLGSAAPAAPETKQESKRDKNKDRKKGKGKKGKKGKQDNKSKQDKKSKHSKKNRR